MNTGQAGARIGGSRAAQALKVFFSVIFSWPTLFRYTRKLSDRIAEAVNNIERYRFRDVKKTVRYKSFNNWTFPRGFCRATMESTFWAYFILLVILANAAIDGYSCDHEVVNDGEIPFWTEVVNVFFLSVYTLEFFMMIIAHGVGGYFTNRWCLFDFIVLILCYVPYAIDSLSVNLNFLRTFRALRGIRVFRSVAFIPRLQTLFDAIKQTLFSAVWLIILLFIFILVFAITALYVFGEKVPDPWGNLATSLLHTFAITTKDAWNVYQDDLDREYGESSRVFSVVVVIVCGLIISSLVVAAVTDNFEDCANKNSKAIAKIRRQKVAAYREDNKEKERQATSERMENASNDYEAFEKERDQQYAGTETRKIKPQKSMFCNPKWMASIQIVLSKIRERTEEREMYYQQLFECLVDLSEIGVADAKDSSNTETS